MSKCSKKEVVSLLAKSSTYSPNRAPSVVGNGPVILSQAYGQLYSPILEQYHCMDVKSIMLKHGLQLL
jgi:hypothetical protein